MEITYLLPSKFKRIGWLLLIPSAILGFMTVAYEWEPVFFDVKVFAIMTDSFPLNFKWIGRLENNILDEILGILLIISCLMVAFSKEPEEDELIASLRLKALVWATYWNYGILLLAFILVYDISFFWVMIFNMYTILIFFIIKFNWSLRQLRKSIAYEE